jgi:predicted MFS family arabinose efflux permease
MAFPILSRIPSAIGFPSLYNSSWNTKVLCASRFIRLFAYGASTLVLVLYLKALGISEARVGQFMTATLIGDTLLSFLLTLFADGLGRRKVLAAGAALMAASGLCFMLSGNFWVLLVASVVGVISPR